MEQKYTVKTWHRRPVTANLLAAEEEKVIEILKGYGYAAGFQLETCFASRNKARRKIKKMANTGIIIKHQLAGKKCTFNVYTYTLVQKFDLERALKRVTLLQLDIASRHAGGRVIPLDNRETYWDGVWFFRDKEIPVISIRSKDEESLLRYLPWQQIKRVVIISPRPLSYVLPVPARLVLDSDLLKNKLIVRHLNGEIDTIFSPISS